MKLYHGGTERIERPDVSLGRGNLDFGRGFYLTNLEPQARTWAIDRMHRRASDQAVINAYELDSDKARAMGARWRQFERYDAQWLSYVVDCRRGVKLWEQYDIVEGGVANDRVINTVELYLREMITAEEAIKRLAHTEPTHQICLISQAVIDNCLIFKGMEVING